MNTFCSVTFTAENRSAVLQPRTMVEIVLLAIILDNDSKISRSKVSLYLLDLSVFHENDSHNLIYTFQNFLLLLKINYHFNLVYNSKNLQNINEYQNALSKKPS